eukprot:6050097-Amphidinium_carterae.1
MPMHPAETHPCLHMHTFCPSPQRLPWWSCRCLTHLGGAIKAHYFLKRLQSMCCDVRALGLTLIQLTHIATQTNMLGTQLSTRCGKVRTHFSLNLMPRHDDDNDDDLCTTTASMEPVFSGDDEESVPPWQRGTLAHHHEK